jgi:hypothetical protein
MHYIKYRINNITPFIKNVPYGIGMWGTWQHSWFRHYTTSWRVVGSIPDEVIGFFN